VGKIDSKRDVGVVKLQEKREKGDLSSLFLCFFSSLYRLDLEKDEGRDEDKRREMQGSTCPTAASHMAHSRDYVRRVDALFSDAAKGCLEIIKIRVAR